MLKLITQTVGLRQFENIPINVDHQKFGSVINTITKQISKKWFSQECKFKYTYFNKNIF